MRRAAARSGEWAQHFSNASCLFIRLGLGLIIPTYRAILVLRVIWQCDIFGSTSARNSSVRRRAAPYGAVRCLAATNPVRKRPRMAPECGNRGQSLLFTISLVRYTVDLMYSLSHKEPATTPQRVHPQQRNLSIHVRCSTVVAVGRCLCV